MATTEHSIYIGFLLLACIGDMEAIAKLSKLPSDIAHLENGGSVNRYENVNHRLYDFREKFLQFAISTKCFAIELMHAIAGQWHDGIFLAKQWRSRLWLKLSNVSERLDLQDWYASLAKSTFKHRRKIWMCFFFLSLLLLWRVVMFGYDDVSLSRVPPLVSYEELDPLTRDVKCK